MCHLHLPNASWNRWRLREGKRQGHLSCEPTWALFSSARTPYCSSGVYCAGQGVTIASLPERKEGASVMGKGEWRHAPLFATWALLLSQSAARPSSTPVGHLSSGIPGSHLSPFWKSPCLGWDTLREKRDGWCTKSIKVECKQNKTNKQTSKNSFSCYLSWARNLELFYRCRLGWQLLLSQLGIHLQGFSVSCSCVWPAPVCVLHITLLQCHIKYSLFFLPLHPQSQYFKLQSSSLCKHAWRLLYFCYY